MSAAVSVDEKRQLTVLTNSALACARRCLREYRYRYIQLRRPRRTTEALRFGTFFDAGLGAWWSANGEPAHRFDRAITTIRVRAESNPEDSDPFDLVKAEELLLGYTARWGDAGYETIGTQVEFEVPLVNPDTGAESRTYKLRGKLDAIAEKDRRRSVIEHKTTSSDIGQGSDYWRKVSALDPQISTYIAGANAAGHNVEDCLYDVVRKVAMRPFKATPEESRRYTKVGRLDVRQHEHDEAPEAFRLRVRAAIAEAPEKYFARGPIVRLERDAAEHAADTWQMAWILRESENAGRYPRSPGSCERFGRFCDFFEVCSGNASIDDDVLYRTADGAHEELSREV